MEEIRCGSCRRLLMKSAKNAIIGPVEIKCPRCGTLTSLRPLVPDQKEPVPKEPSEPYSKRHKSA
ncbi:Com family DNA-binding transcriptional regulator [Roseibium sp. MB-4]